MAMAVAIHGRGHKPTATGDCRPHGHATQWQWHYQRRWQLRSGSGSAGTTQLAEQPTWPSLQQMAARR